MEKNEPRWEALLSGSDRWLTAGLHEEQQQSTGLSAQHKIAEENSRHTEGEVWPKCSASSCLMISTGSRGRNRGEGWHRLTYFPFCLSGFPYSVLLRSTGRGEKKGEAEKRRSFSWSWERERGSEREREAAKERESQGDRAVRHSICGNMMEASVVSKDTGWVCKWSVVMSLGENTGYELLLCLSRGVVVTVTKGRGAGGSKVRQREQEKQTWWLTD